MTVLGQNAEETDQDLKVERSVNDPNQFTVTDLASKESTQMDLSSFLFEHNSLIKIEGGKNIGSQVFQLVSTENDIKFDFYYEGGKVETLVYDEDQYRYKGYNATVKKVDTTKSILSPMPGAVVSVAVKQGDVIVDGQELCIIEAMKMQNILKSERDGVIKSVRVKAGDSVAVDELLIEFEWAIPKITKTHIKSVYA